jgi:hypothetical protein
MDEWFQPIRHAVVLAQQNRGRDANMRGAVLAGLARMPSGVMWVFPPELIQRIAPIEARPTRTSVLADPQWLVEALHATECGFTVDADELPGRLVVTALAA